LLSNTKFGHDDERLHETQKSISICSADIQGVSYNITGEQAKRPSSIIDQRDHVLELIGMTREDITDMSDEQLAEARIEGLPFWHIINRPISDALSHVGQINMACRLMGKPTPEANVFRGDPPP
jgi:hypothetical protein